MILQACLRGASIPFVENLTARGAAKATKIAIVASVFSLGGVGLSLISSALGAPVTFEFPDGSPFDAGTGTNPVAGYTQVETKDGLTLATVDVQAPKYVVNPENSSQYLWDGETYVTRFDSPPVRTNVNGTNWLGIDNPTITNSQFASESQNIHPDESWTFKFDLPVKFTQIVFNSLDGNDKANVIVGAPEDALISVDFTADGGGTKSDPFNGLLIPADTHITFTNTADSILTINGTMSGLSVWRIRGFTVEIVQSSLLGDYNDDGIVDAADYVLWRDVLGGPADSLLNRDPGNEDAINQADHEFWKANFGNPSALASGATVNAVPEPAALALTGIAFVAWAAVGQRKREGRSRWKERYVTKPCGWSK